MAHGGGYVSDRVWREMRLVRARDLREELAERMRSPPAAFKLSRACTRPDERFDTIQDLARRLHGLRKGRAIHCRVGYNARACKPNGACVSVRLEESGELLGHCFIAHPLGGEADRQRLQDALRATEGKPDFLAQLGEDAEAA